MLRLLHQAQPSLIMLSLDPRPLEYTLRPFNHLQLHLAVVAVRRATARTRDHFTPWSVDRREGAIGAGFNGFLLPWVS